MPEVLDDNQAAIDELFAVASEGVLGFPQPTVNGIGAEAVVEELTYDEIMAAGGTGESGGFTAIFRIADLAEIPSQGNEITIREFSLEVMSVKRNIVYITAIAGDPVSNQ